MLLDAERCWILDARFWINQKKKNFLLHPASSDQHLASAYYQHQNLKQKLDTNFRISVYKDI